MTAPTPTGVMVAATDQGEGCTGCGSQKTVVLHPHHGRRCSDCMTLPPGGFRSELAADMVEMGRADGAFAYLEGWLRAEADRRFATVPRSLR